jgi:hypothetical protein
MLTSVMVIRPDFALHRNHLSCQGQQQPKRTKVVVLHIRKHSTHNHELQGANEYNKTDLLIC